jgi:non-heme chloroperoxidase
LLETPVSARESRASAVSRLTDPIDPRFVLDFQQSTLARPIASAFLDTMVQESLKVPARVWRAALGALLESSFSSEISAISAPTLIVWGEQDAIASRSDQQVLANGIAGAQLRIYGRTGHAVHCEEPKRFASDLTSFVTGCGIGTPAPPFNTEIANERPRTPI